jgi:hypothetical protein
MQGHDHLPYPFMETGRPGGNDVHTPGQHAISQRFEHGDLRIFQNWTKGYARADIWVECRVLYRSAAIPDIRICAFRADQVGFCGSQRADQDVVDVDQLGPYELGSAITNALALNGPGGHPRISVPKYVNYFTNSTVESHDEDDYELSVSDHARQQVGPSAAIVPDAQVAAIGTVQSRCEPARSWGMDWQRNLVVWVQVSDDGDYVYQPDFDHAVPMTKQKLMGRIDQLIAEDVAVVRRRQII